MWTSVAFKVKSPGRTHKSERRHSLLAPIRFVSSRAVQRRYLTSLLTTCFPDLPD
jgi:hypothetical protein